MIRKLLPWLLVLVLLLGFFVFRPAQGQPAPPVTPAQVQAAFRLLASSFQGEQPVYLDYLAQEGRQDGSNTAWALPTAMELAEIAGQQGHALDYRNTLSYSLDIKQAGLYCLQLHYLPLGKAMSDFVISLSVNGNQDYQELGSISLPLFWQSQPGDFPRDSYGDQAAPGQVRVEGWRVQLLNSRLRSTEEPLLVYLASGRNTLAITNLSNDGLVVGALQAVPPQRKLPSYASYLDSFAFAAPANALIRLEAEHYLEKNDAEAVFEALDNPALHPHSVGSKLLNTLSWGKDGSEITWQFDVETEGSYQLAFHYRNDKPEFAAFHSILIDGQLPFAECRSYAFPVTQGNWTNETLKSSDGQAYRFYLTKGSHSLTLRMEKAPLMQAWRYARLISAHVMRFSLQVTELAGSQIDRSRTWRMTRYIPEIADYLAAYQTLIYQIKHLTQDDSQGGASGALYAELDRALNLIKGMQRYPDEIALYTAQLTGADNSLLVCLSRFTSQLTADAFSLDAIYIGQGQELPPANAGVFRAAGNWLASLAHTFTTDKYRQRAGDGQTLTIWVNRALTHVDLLQKMVDTDFTQQTGIKVKLSALTDPGKLTMSASAGTTPDLALGLASYMPFDLASRGALLDLSSFPDFWRFAGQMPPGTLVPYLYNEGVYAIPETLDFACLVYRRDIFENFGFQVPDTWEQVTAMLPELQRHGMNFFHNIAQGTGYKWFYQTTPLIYQHGGVLYSQDGYKTAIQQPEAIAGIQALGRLFIAYSLDVQVTSFFDAFRYAVQPVGILDSATYILLKNGAPELQGQWALAPYPGTQQADGSISRWFIANGQGGVVFKDTQLKEEAWAFLKWWLSRETQVQYSYLLRSTFGEAFLWLPANLQALQDAPVDRADLDIILASAAWLRDVPRTPGQYIVERSLSDIWNQMVTQGVSAQVAVDEKVVQINREIRKKMTELGYFDQVGQQLKPYVVRDIDWIARQMQEGGGPP